MAESFTFFLIKRKTLMQSALVSWKTAKGETPWFRNVSLRSWCAYQIRNAVFPSLSKKRCKAAFSLALHLCESQQPFKSTYCSKMVSLLQPKLAVFDINSGSLTRCTQLLCEQCCFYLDRQVSVQVQCIWTLFLRAKCTFPVEKWGSFT